MTDDSDRVAKLFKGKCIFITGGTGFIGKVLIEKLLRSCSELDTIYLLIREKRAKSPQQRIKEIFKSTLFETLRKTRPEAMNQLVAIPGDVLEPDLGISAEHRALLTEKVHIVYHCAATIRFDEPLKKAVLLNTRGTKLLLELAEEFKHLLAFVYVSTSYCHLQETLIKEILYDPPADPHKIIKAVEILDDKLVNIMEKTILKKIPNTYAYTKALAEGLVNEKIRQSMPCMIARPSLVLPIWKEPVPGWTDNLNGIVGIFIACGKGVLRTIYGDANVYFDLITVDLVCNILLTATWNYVENPSTPKKSVYHVTTSLEIKVTLSEMHNIAREIGLTRIPLNYVVWYPNCTITNSRLLHNIKSVLYHWIPAYIIDAIMFLIKRKPFMVRIQQRISNGLKVIEYFLSHQWDFVNDNTKELRHLQNNQEKMIYNLLFQDINKFEYFESTVRAARVNLLKEMPETLPAAKRHLKMMYWIDKIFKVLFWYLMFYLITSYSQTAKNTSDMIFDYAKSFVPPAIMGTSDVTSHEEM